jgi:hypothetical protein
MECVLDKLVWLGKYTVPRGEEDAGQITIICIVDTSEEDAWKLVDEDVANSCGEGREGYTVDQIKLGELLTWK